MLSRLAARRISQGTCLILRPHQIPLIAPSAKPLIAKHKLNEPNLYTMINKKIITKEDILLLISKPAQQQTKMPSLGLNKKQLGFPEYIDIPIVAAPTSNPKIDVPNQYAKQCIDVSSPTAFIEKLEKANLIKKGQISVVDFLVKAYGYSLFRNQHLNIVRRNNIFSTIKPIGISIPFTTKGSVQWKFISAINTKGLSKIHSEIATSQLLSQPVECSSTFHLPLDGVLSITEFVKPPHTLAISFGEIFREAVEEAGKLVAKPMINCCLASDGRIINDGESAELLQTMTEVLQDVRYLHL